MTAVGATNVGSVKVGLDPNLTNNTRRWELDTFHQEVWEVGPTRSLIEVNLSFIGWCGGQEG